MRLLLKIILIATLLCISSCVDINISQELDDRKIVSLTTSDTAHLSINIINGAENITLKINNLDVEGVDSIYSWMRTMDSVVLTYQDSATVYNIWTIPQKIEKGYIILIGEILLNNNIIIYKGEILIPLWNKQIYINNDWYFELYDNCPWYCIINGNSQKVLQSIKFKPVIENWK